MNLKIGLLMTSLFWSSLLFADAGTCSMVWQLADRLGCYPAQSASNTEIGKSNPQFVLTSDFGPSNCKAKTLTTSIKADLDKECQSWLKERKSDLGGKYHTGTCTADCTPCAQGLEQCKVKGLVHYATAN